MNVQPIPGAMYEVGAASQRSEALSRDNDKKQTLSGPRVGQWR